MRKGRKNKRNYKRLMLIVAGAVVLCILGMFIWNQFFAGDDKKKRSDGLVNVMILGVDKRSDDAGRSDTLMLVSLDKKTNRAELISIPRDTYVAIEGHGYDKINHAYAYGGEGLTKKAVEDLMGISVDYYVMVDTHAFPKIIDSIGGVDIDVEKRMYYEDPWDEDGGLVIDLQKGNQHLNGDKAIQYVRYRDSEGDVGRVVRQQKFLSAVIDRMISPDIIEKLPQVIGTISNSVKTDMEPPQLLTFAKQMKKIHEQGVAMDMVPGKPAYYKDVSYWVADLTDLKERMFNKLGREYTDEIRMQTENAEKAYLAKLPDGIKYTEDAKAAESSASEGNVSDTKDKTEVKDTKDASENKPQKAEEITVMVVNSSGIDGAGARVAEVLKEKGFKISTVETGKTDTLEQTSVTVSKENTDLFYGMPFPCIIYNGGSRSQAVVNIGRDYKK